MNKWTSFCNKQLITFDGQLLLCTYHISNCHRNYGGMYINESSFVHNSQSFQCSEWVKKVIWVICNLRNQINHNESKQGLRIWLTSVTDIQEDQLSVPIMIRSSGFSQTSRFGYIHDGWFLYIAPCHPSANVNLIVLCKSTHFLPKMISFNNRKKGSCCQLCYLLKDSKFWE